MKPIISLILSNGKAVYRAGEIVNGECIVNTEEPIKAKSVKVYFKGVALTKWKDYELGVGHAGHYLVPKVDSKDVKSRENYFHYVQTLWPVRNEQVPVTHLIAGAHRWTFSFRLPNRPLPSSFEDEHGAVRYWLQVVINKPFPWPDTKRYRCITVLDNLNLNYTSYMNPVKGSNSKIVSKVLGLGNAGKLQISASSDRKGYCPGEDIAITATMSNNSTKDMGQTVAKLIQVTKFVAGDKNKREERTLAITTGSGLRKGETKQWISEGMSIPAVPPTSRSGSCHIVNVHYHIKMYIEVPFGFDLHVYLPVIIGTVPIGYRTGLDSRTVASASPPITKYTNCYSGFSHFDGDEPGFPSMLYTPMTAFVANFVLGTPLRPLSQTAATVKPKATSLPAKTSSLPEIKTGGLLIRFSPEKVPEFQSSLRANKATLEEHGAFVVGLIDKVEFVRGKSWSIDKAIGIMVFPTLDQARAWVSSTPDVSENDWIGGAEIVLFAMKEPHKEFKQSFLSVQIARCPKAVTKEKLVAYGKLGTHQLRKLRAECNGALIVSTASKGYFNLRGGLASLPYIYSIHQWPNRAMYDKYMTVITSNTALLGAWNEIWCEEGLVTMETMDVSWLSEEPVVVPANTLTDKPKATELDNSSDVYLIFRFPSTHTDCFRSAIVKNKEELKLAKGKIIVLASKFTLLKGESSMDDKSLSIVRFHRKETAKEWFSNLVQSNNHGWLSDTDVVLSSAKEPVNDDLSYFVCTTSSVKADVPVPVKQYIVKDIVPLVKATRIRMNGVAFAIASSFKKNFEILSGSWPPSGYNLSCEQWPDHTAYKRYRDEVKQELIKISLLLELKSKFSFETEDLSELFEDGLDKGDKDGATDVDDEQPVEVTEN